MATQHEEKGEEGQEEEEGALTQRNTTEYQGCFPWQQRGDGSDRPGAKEAKGERKQGQGTQGAQETEREGREGREGRSEGVEVQEAKAHGLFRNEVGSLPLTDLTSTPAPDYGTPFASLPAADPSIPRLEQAAWDHSKDAIAPCHPL